MKDPIITYRGASCHLSELDDNRQEQLQQRQATRLVSYRGTEGQVALKPHVNKVRTITYRGATAQMDV